MAYPTHSNLYGNARANSVAGQSDEPPSQAMAAGLAFFFGWIGVHKFYLGQITKGILSVIFAGTGIPFIVGMVDAIKLALMPSARFKQRYWRYQPGADEDDVLDAHLRTNHSAPQEAVALQATYNLAEGTAFTHLVTALNEATQGAGLSFATAQGNYPTGFLSNTLPMGSSMLPTVTLQSERLSLLFTPRQLIAKRGTSIRILGYKDVQFDYVEPDTTTQTPAAYQKQPKIKDVLSGLFTGKESETFTIGKLFTEAERFLQNKPLNRTTIVDVPYQRLDQLAITLPGGTAFVLQHSNQAQLASILQALQGLRRLG
jgi:TM2 domain-containing membrane protein YozV